MHKLYQKSSALLIPGVGLVVVMKSMPIISIGLMIVKNG